MEKFRIILHLAIYIFLCDFCRITCSLNQVNNLLSVLQYNHLEATLAVNGFYCLVGRNGAILPKEMVVK